MSRTMGFLLAVIALIGPVQLTGAAELDHILFQTIRRRDNLLLETLLRQGTPVSLQTTDGTTPLMYAALRGNAQSVRLLIKRGADPKASNDIGATALLWAAGDREKVRMLLDQGADPNARSKLGNTPLIAAAAYPDSTATLELLLAAGAKIQEKNRAGVTALRQAVTAGDLESVKLLLDKGAGGSKKGLASELAIAAGRGYREIVEVLLEHKASPNSANGRSALNAALLAQQPDIARLLIKKGASLKQNLRPGNVPPVVLSAYTEIGDTSVAKLMIEKGVDVQAANQYDETALIWARKRGNQQLVDLYVKAGSPDEPLKTKQIPDHPLKLEDSNRKDVLTSSVAKATKLLQVSSDGFLKRRENCVSCHHQNLPAVALGWAHERGLDVDEASIERMITAQLRSWRPRIDRAYQMDRPVPVAPRFIGYGLIGFAALGYPRDEVTDAMVWYLAAIQQPDGHWVPGMLRPPMGGAEIVATSLAMRALQLYPLEGSEKELKARVQRAKDWLAAAQPRLHQERVFKLIGLGWAGVPPAELGDTMQELLEEQREDGGWAQLPQLGSDAWATGQTLVALHTAGGLPTDHDAYRRGIEFLLRSQFADGSWYVRSRTWPFQTHFESKFPHGKDQWVSAPATAWSAMALTLALEPSKSRTVLRGNVSAKADTPATPDRPSKPTTTPDLSVGRVDYVKHIKPILQRSCASCHSGEKPKAGFDVTKRASLLQGGDSGEAAIVAGQSQRGQLLQFVSDRVEDLEMPPLRSRKKFPALTESEIKLLRNWIQQGAKFDDAQP